MMHSHLTDCGLPGVPQIPFGVHMCNFYRTREDLARGVLADGSSGLRITGNVTFRRPEEWALFMEYEELVNKSFHGRRIVTLCTYWLEQCGSAEMLELLQRHNGALDRPDEGWQILTQS